MSFTHAGECEPLGGRVGPFSTVMLDLHTAANAGAKGGPMGVAVTLILLGALFGVLAVIADPGVFAVLLAVTCVAAGLAFGIFSRPRTSDR